MWKSISTYTQRGEGFYPESKPSPLTNPNARTKLKEAYRVGFESQDKPYWVTVDTLADYQWYENHPVYAKKTLWDGVIGVYQDELLTVAAPGHKETK